MVQRTRLDRRRQGIGELKAGQILVAELRVDTIKIPALGLSQERQGFTQSFVGDRNSSRPRGHQRSRGIPVVVT